MSRITSQIFWIGFASSDYWPMPERPDYYSYTCDLLMLIRLSRLNTRPIVKGLRYNTYINQIYMITRLMIHDCGDFITFILNKQAT